MGSCWPGWTVVIVGIIRRTFAVDVWRTVNNYFPCRLFSSRTTKTKTNEYFIRFLAPLKYERRTGELKSKSFTIELFEHNVLYYNRITIVVESVEIDAGHILTMFYISYYEHDEWFTLKSRTNHTGNRIIRRLMHLKLYLNIVVFNLQ